MAWFHFKDTSQFLSELEIILNLKELTAISNYSKSKMQNHEMMRSKKINCVV